MSLLFRKTVACLLASALIAFAPGIEPYRLFAQAVGAAQVPASVATPGVGSAGGAAASVSAPAGSGLAVSGLSANLGANLPGGAGLLPAITVGPDLRPPAGLAGPVAAAAIIRKSPALTGTAPASSEAAFPRVNPRSAASPNAIGVPSAPTADFSTLNRSEAVRNIRSGKAISSSLGNIFSGSRSRETNGVAAGPVAAARSLQGRIGGGAVRLNKAGADQKAESGDAVDSPKTAETKVSEKTPGFFSSPSAWAKGKVKGFLSDPSNKKFWTGSIAALIAGLFITQIAQEFYGQSMPQLIKGIYGNFGVYASLSMFRLVGRIVGNAVGGVLPERFGLKKVYLWSEVGRAVSIAGIVALLLTGTTSIPLLGAAVAVNGFFTGIAITAERSLPRVLLGADQGLLEKFRGYYQFILEFAGIGAPLLAGFIITSTGTFAWTLGAFPLIMGAAILFFWKFLKVPAAVKKAVAENGNAPAPNAAPKAKTGAIQAIIDAFKKTGTRFYDGMKVTAKTPALRTAALGEMLFLMLNVFLYTIVAPAFGLYIIGQTWDPALLVDAAGALTMEASGAAANIQAWTVGVYSLGSLLGAVLMLRGNRKLEKLKDEGKIDKKEYGLRMKRSTLRWMGVGALSLLLFLPMIGLNPWIAYGGMLFFGMLSVVPSLKVESLAQTLIPDGEVETVNGFIQMAMSALAAGAVFGVSMIFDTWVTPYGTPSQTAFMIMGGLLVGLSVVLFGVRWLLSRQLDLPVRTSFKAEPVLPPGFGWLRFIAPRPVLRLFFSAEKAELRKLEKSLSRLGYGKHRVETVSEPVPADRPTVAILAPASVYKLAIAREGGRQSPGDVHLALDPSWLIQEKDADGTARILLKKGLYFDSEGRAVVAEYKTPRPVRYFANFFTLGANDRGDGVPYEKGLGTPMSSSVELESVTNDKLLTRILMAANGVAVPATLAFLLAAHPLAAKADEPPAGPVTIARMSPDPAAIRERVIRHLEANKAVLGGEVVVKPSGPQWHSSRGVEIFKTSQVSDIVAHVIALSNDPMMTEDGSVLIDSRLTPPALHFKATPKSERGPPTAGRHTGEGIRADGDVVLDFLTPEEIPGSDPKFKRDWNLRLYAERTPWGEAKISGIFVRAGRWGKPVVAEPGGPNGRYDIEDAAVIVKFEDVVRALREQHGLLKTEAEAEEFEASLQKTAEGTLRALTANEEALRAEGKIPAQAQTDFIGLDIMLNQAGGALVPTAIEINDHDSGGQMQLERFYPETPGKHSEAWVATMLAKARRDALKGKTIVFVGAGYEGKRPMMERAKELGVKIVLIDKPDSWAAEYADTFIPADMLDMNAALEAAKGALTGRELDGIFTFWEDDVPLSAKLAGELGLKHFSFKSALVARNKAATRAMLEKAGIPTPRFHPVNSEADLSDAIEKVGFPAILKPAAGAEAKFVQRVMNAAEAEKAFKRIRADIAEAEKTDGAFSGKVGLVMEQYLDGDEVDVDIVMQDGKMVFASVTDNWPTREPFFVATGSNLPSRLGKPARDALMESAGRTANALGLTDGVFHIEMKQTAEGPRLIEANARIGGTYVYEWVKAVWGVDLLEEALMTAAGVPGTPHQAPEARTHLDGEFFIPKKSGTLLKFTGTEAVSADPALFQLRKFLTVGDAVTLPEDGGVDRVAMTTAKGRSADEARANRKRLTEKLDIVVARPGSDEWLKAKFVPSPRGFVFAKFRSDEYKPEYEARVKALGADAVYIRRPSKEQLDAHPESEGWFLKPRWVRWVMPAKSEEDFLAGLKGSTRRKMKQRYDNSKQIPFEVKPLTPEDFAEWHPIYVDEVVNRPGGRSHLGTDWAQKKAADGTLDGWHGIWFRDPETNEMIGGMIFADLPERGYVSMGFAAYRPKAKKYDVSYRASLEAMKKAVEWGRTVISAGADTNFYGYDYSLGLLGWKAQNQMHPFPEEPFELLKVLNPGKFKSETDHEGRRAGYFFFTLRRDTDYVRRYLDVEDKYGMKATDIMKGGFFGEGAAAPNDLMVGRQFYFDDLKIATPSSIDTERTQVPDDGV